MLGQIIRFGGVGGIATLVHVSVALLMHGAFGLLPLQANFAGFAGSLLFSYAGHARFTFGVRLNQGSQFLRFVFVALVALATSSGTVWILGTGLGLGFGFSMLAVAVLVPAVTFLALRFWVFDAARPGRRTDWIGLGVSGALALAVLALFWGRMINHDTAWFLIATREWLGGAELYTDLIEVNPPLNFYYTLPAVWLADLFGISDTNGEYLAMSLLIFLILLWCSAIIRDELGFAYIRRALLLSGIAVALVLPTLDEFGQREQVMVILIMPWLLGQTASAPASLRSQIARAGVAALGICLKPHFVLFPVAVTVFLMLRRRSLWPIFSVANFTFLGVGLSYIGYVVLVHPAYLSEIVPLARQIYGAYGSPFEIVFFRIGIDLLVVLIPGLFVLLRRPLQPEIGLFATLALAALGSYFLQGAGFSYHAIPFSTFAFIAFCFAIIRSPGPNAAVIAAGIAIAGLTAVNIDRGFYENEPSEQIAQIAQDLGKVDSLMVLSADVFVGPPVAIAIGARWASRYPANWLVPGAMNRLDKLDCTSEPETCTRLQAIAARNRTDNLTDIATTRPDLLVLDRRSEFFDRADFTWEEFMTEDPAWSGVLEDYAEIGRSERLIYFYYTPKPQ